jgi:hypothetical protein
MEEKNRETAQAVKNEGTGVKKGVALTILAFLIAMALL